MSGQPGLCPRPRWGSLQHPRPLARLKALLLERREGRAEKVEGREGKRERTGKGNWYPHFLGESYAPVSICLWRHAKQRLFPKLKMLFTWTVIDDVADMSLSRLVECVEKQLKLLRRLATEH